ncbi:hypothetical protein UFOVP181_159 [uncultured Caudovirales phage]|uniref:Uncharacterized protein n=1 Tax=uncultured Caudovirales phage TaxID=2100421 RepID=A0A6J5KRS8_9CAUD|nr:hypothetical protein UFOVP57_3 [uncultured Caudovirales phage]CAB5208770.1 hypothetical protein UFOVP181_159 [uncultured Caudovirales phage]
MSEVRAFPGEPSFNWGISIMGLRQLCKLFMRVRFSHPPPSLCRRIVMSHGGKGDRRRPLVVPKEVFENNWDSIFGKKKKPEPESQANKQKDNK